MKNFIGSKLKKTLRNVHLWFSVSILLILFFLFFTFPEFFTSAVSYPSNIDNTVLKKDNKGADDERKILKPVFPPLDTALYDKKLNEIVNNPVPKPTPLKKDKDGNIIPAPVAPLKQNLWPVKTVYPNPGAILPFNRIVAYYGNLYSTKMGVLGQYPETEMLQRLDAEVKKWNDTDPTTPVVPALHYIAVVAQGSAGKDGKYRARMPGTEIDKVLKMADKINAIVFLDIQVGFSNLQAEVPLLERYLKLPNVHLGIDPEFSMKNGIKPGKVVGTLDASDINFAAGYLAKIVKENDLPPKVLVVHRYTQKMVTNYHLIKNLPEVQIVMNMDGWGDAAKKINTYKQFIYKEPVQFTGFKLFYKNDLFTKGTVLMAPEELLKLNPQPVYIQYQ